MTDKKEAPFEDRFALKVKPDTRLNQVRVFKKETIDKFKKLNSRRKKEEKRNHLFTFYISLPFPIFWMKIKGRFIDFLLKVKKRV